MGQLLLLPGVYLSERQAIKKRPLSKESLMKVFTAVLASALFIVPAALLAQTPTPGANDYNINQRKVAQQDRIANGVKSGQLTAGETARLEHQEAGINKEERGMRAQDNGHLTKQDRATIHAQQNQESRRIYRDKHNAAVR
jgi:hypothetical protein